jgi:hypothetical protein
VVWDGLSDAGKGAALGGGGRGGGGFKPQSGLKPPGSSLTFPSLQSMSAEYKRVFSSTKKLITPERNRQVEEIIEAPECELIHQLEE